MLSDSIGVVQVQLAIETDVETDAVIEIRDRDQNWIGGGRKTIAENTNGLVVFEIPLIVQPEIGREYLWESYLTISGGAAGTYRAESAPLIFTDDPTIAATVDAVHIVMIPSQLNPGEQTEVTVGYEAVTGGYISVSITDSTGKWIGGGHGAVAAGQGTVAVPVTISPKSEAGSYSSVAYMSSLKGDWRRSRRWSERVTGIVTDVPGDFICAAVEQEQIIAGDQLTLAYAYGAKADRDLVFDVFSNEPNQWKTGVRITVLLGGDTASVDIDTSTLSPGQYRINGFSTAAGADWTEAVDWSESLSFTILPKPPAKLESGDLFYPQSWTSMDGSEVSFDREVIVRIPDEAVEGEKLPVVILLHGSNGNAESMIGTHFYLRNRIMVSCQGYQNDWNISYDAHQAPDVDFFRQLITDLKTYDNVDPDQIAILGWSNGTGMVHRLMIELGPDRFSTAICLAQPLRKIQYNNDSFWFDLNGRWDYTEQIQPGNRRVLNIHGGSDSLLSVDGIFLTDPGVPELWLTSLESIHAWAQAMGYNGPRLEAADGVIDPEGTTYSYLDGQVVYYQLEQGSHDLMVPGSERTRMAELVQDFLD